MIKSRKKILEESSKELLRIQENIKIQEKYPENEWYVEMDVDIFEPIIKRENIKKLEVLEKVKLCEMIDKKNGIYSTILYVTKSPKLYSKLIEMAEPLKSKKFLYSWFISLLKDPVTTIVNDYNMDPLMILEYLLKNKNKPKMNSSREHSIMSIANYYYIQKKYKKGASYWLSQLAHALLLGI